MKVCLYSPVDDVSLFATVGFYRDDLIALGWGGEEVSATNSLAEVWGTRPDVLVGYFYTRSLFPAALARLRGGRAIFTGGADSISPKLSHGRALLLRRLTAISCAVVAERIVVPSEEDLNNFRALLSRSSRLSRKVQRAPHVVNVPDVAVPPRPALVGRFSAFTICWMGTTGNAVRKGVDRSVELIAGLASIGTDATLTIAGVDGPGWPHIQELARERGVGDRVKFVGRISEAEKLAYFRESDAYLQLSRHEGFGVAAAEALCAGIPVIHTGQGGLRDAIGEGGLLVNDDSRDYSSPEWIAQFLEAFTSFRPDPSVISRKRSEFSYAARHIALLGDEMGLT